MVDLDQLRNQPDLFRTSLKNRFTPIELVDDVLNADTEWRLITTRADALRAERNLFSKTQEAAQAHRGRLKEIKKELDRLEEQETTVAAHRAELLARLPNLLDDEVPIGEGESANKPIKKVGTIKVEEGSSHEELMTKLDWLDLLSAAKTSGARFRYLKGPAALAQMRLANQAFEFAIKEGFIPIIPPSILRPQVLEAAGHFPEGQEDTFKVGELYLTGTSEYSLVGQAMDKVFEEKDLPLRYIGFSTCFRKEAGSYGKDVRGMFRQHQFDKVEMISICTAEQSKKEHEFLLQMQEKFISQFDLPYQVVLIGSGDVEKKAIKRYDIETWFPGQKQYRETHSVSNCTDYQARGLSVKYRSASGDVKFAHTLNGTLATERLLLAIVENNQAEDGSVKLPSQLTL